MMRVCSEPGCPELQTEGRCLAHRRDQDMARGSAAERGYGADHRALRERWAAIVATGHAKCWRCATYIDPGTPWDLGHDDIDRAKYRGPEHVACNRATSGRTHRVNPPPA